jgi:NSS family neurotransmitter:Na+ symporter
MNGNTSSKFHETVSWVGKWTFVLAAAGSAVGLGNIWGFPYKAGTEGGGAFVMIYLLCILAVGLPIMMAEIIIGRRAMKTAAIDSGQTSKWQAVGWGGLISGILILSFYSVIAGICLNYIIIAAFPTPDISSIEQFNIVTSSPSRLLFWHSIFIALNIIIISAGVIGGIERMVRLLMPALFILMMVMVVNAMINGDFVRGLSFLFAPDFSQVDATTFLRAMGQAFFSLSLGMGSIMCYGAYMPKEENIFRTSLMVAGLDTLIAILAGLAIFPIIFAYGLEPGAGPGLVFVSLLSAFVDMPLGNIVGPAFFALLSIAALSSAISLLEPSVAYFEEENIVSRFSAALTLGLFAWVIGIGSVLSFNDWSDISFIGDLNFLDSIDYLANQFLMPIGGMMVAIFAGWFLKPNLALDEFSDIDLVIFKVWRFFIKFISPVLVAAVFVYQLVS